MIESYWAIALGGASGALLRSALLRLRTRAAGHTDGNPTGGDRAAQATLTANLLGCGTLGLWIAIGSGLPLWLSAFIVTGFCGGLTTFSTLIADLTRLSEQHHRGAALGYLALTFGGGLVVLWLGIRLGALLLAD